MPTSTNVTNLMINELTEAQYDSAVQGGTIGANEISIITDLDDAIQVATLPAASASEEGKIYQFVGTTTASYTNGYFYKCVSDGGNPATYSWTQVNVQPQGSSLPSQTGNSGKFLTTDGTDASWATINALQNSATGSGTLQLLPVGSSLATTNAISLLGLYSNDNGIAIGYRSYSYRSYGIGIGYEAYCYGDYSIAIGNSSVAGAAGNAGRTNCIAIGYNSVASGDKSIAIGYGANNTIANTFKIGNDNGNFEMMSADGTIPTDRFTTTPVADGTYVPTLTISSGVATRSWAAPSGGGGGGSTSATATLAVNDWSSNTQTVSVTGVTSSNNVIVSAAPASQADYTAAGVICTAQGAGTLTFTCTTTPSSALTVNVLII